MRICEAALYVGGKMGRGSADSPVSGKGVWRPYYSLRHWMVR